MRNFILMLVLFCTSTSWAQEIKLLDTDFNDYIPLLKATGYEVFSFDISALNDKTYKIVYTTREYKHGEFVEGSEKEGMYFSNRVMISDFNESDQKNILEKGTAYDAEKGVYQLAERINFGFMPIKSDSIQPINVNVPNIMGFGASLNLHSIEAPNYGKRYAYELRPIDSKDIKIGDYTPLLLYGSFWYDEQFKIFRFCGENKFSPELNTSKTLKHVPHFYTIGIKVLEE